jgi:hypothetical protein
MRQIIRNAWTVGRDIAHQRPTLLRLRPAYESSLAAVGLISRSRSTGGVGAPPAGAVLDATSVTGSLLLLAGNDDELWPSMPMARILAAQRAAAGLDQGDQLVSYEGAGHLIRLGFLPTDAPWTNGIAFGGSREGLAAAQADATSRVVSFLQANAAVSTGSTAQT